MTRAASTATAAPLAAISAALPLGRDPLAFYCGFAFGPFGALAGELLQFGGGPLGLSDFSRLADRLSLGVTS